MSYVVRGSLYTPPPPVNNGRDGGFRSKWKNAARQFPLSKNQKKLSDRIYRIDRFIKKTIRTSSSVSFVILA